MIRSRVPVLFVCALALSAPALGATLTVNAGGNLQAAIDAAAPGDTIVLQAGATFTGQFILRAKGGSSYITIRSSTPDSSLPAPGTRITPAHAPLLAKLRPEISGSAIRTEPGASYWRLQFLEFLPSSSTSGSTLVEFGESGRTNQGSLSQVPHHLVMDRCYVHGDPSYGYRRGLALNSGQAEIINSHFSDFKGIGLETQAIMGWNGPGPFLIENNHLEAAAENVMFGGADPVITNLVPSNITIRRNLITKPVAWKTQSWPLKNLLELKNAQNVLIEGNIFENNWHAGQQGYAIVFTPRNQDGTAPWSVVRNITVQNNVIRHVAGGFSISGYDDNQPSQQTENIKIHNNLVYDVSTAHTTSTPAPGRFMVIGSGPRNISIDHNTVDNDGSGTMLIYAGYTPTGYRIYDFELTNNLLRANQYGIVGDVVGMGTAGFNYYTPNAIVLRNTFAGAPASQYPTGNYFPTIAQWLADFVSVASADYQLTSSSPSNNAATDGTDIGVNFTALNAALAGGSSTNPPPPPSATTPTPYSGTAIALPGTIQAEHYDRGGQGVAYFDTTPGNESAVFRSDDVDLQIAEDTGGGYKLKSAAAGEWLRYSVNVATAGTYTLTVRVTSNGTGGAFHIEVNGVDKTGTMTVPNTGGWQSWQTLTKTGVTLAAGLQSVRLVMDSNGASGLTGNFNWIALSQAATTASTPYSGTPISVPGTIQAENYDHGGEGVAYHDTTSGNSTGLYRTDHVDLQYATDTGSGYKTKDAVAGEWLNYTVNVQTAGTYSIAIRVTSLGGGGTFHVEVNGVDKTGPMTVPNTGGWQAWQTITRTGVSLSSGTQVVRLVLDSNGATGLTGNFNWIAVQ